VRLAIAAPGGVRGDKTDQAFLLGRDAAEIFHDRLIELGKGARDLRPPLHGEHAVRHNAERAAKKLDQVDKIGIVVFRQGLNKRQCSSSHMARSSPDSLLLSLPTTSKRPLRPAPFR
jgi:hypothetical protein